MQTVPVFIITVSTIQKLINRGRLNLDECSFLFYFKFSIAHHDVSCVFTSSVRAVEGHLACRHRNASWQTCPRPAPH